MIIRARIVVTMDGPPIENGAVAVLGDRITDVANFPEISARHAGEEIVDLGEQALLPGLINAHCHLDYTCLRAKIPRQRSFTDWIRAINAEKAKLSSEDYLRSINDGFAEAKKFGTTTIVNLTAVPELASRIEAPIRTWWFAELIDVRDRTRANEIDDSPPGSSPSRAARLRRSAPAGSVVDIAVENLKSEEHWGLAPHAPFTGSDNLYRRCQKVAGRENVLLTTHLAESREEMSMFRDANGPLYDFLRQIGRDMSDCGCDTAVGHFFEILGRGGSPDRSEPDWHSRAIEVNRPHLSWMLVHLNEVEGNDFNLLARTRTKSSVVHCPRSHAYFQHSPFQFRKLRELGFNVCLGTDSLASNNDLSLFAEMRAFQKEFPDVAPEETLKMVTLNPARALQQENALGKIQPGFFADLIAIPVARAAFAKASSAKSTSVFEEIVAFEGTVGWTMLGGEIQGAAGS